MRQTIIILVINILYVILLLHHPKSNICELHKKTNKEIIEQNARFSGDSNSYLLFNSEIPRRTIGFPYLLKFFRLFDNWYIMLLMFNCFLGAWMFFVSFSMVGKWAYLLAGLGSFTAYIPFIYTDLLFAAIFITAIWTLKSKRLWWHFLLLGVASLVRPSLAWFFIIEPFVLYFYGYRGRMVYCSIIICFLATSFNPIRNYIKFGQFIHSDVLKNNQRSEHYYGGADNKVKYMINAFKGNALSGHYDFIGIMFNRYKRDFGLRKKSILMWWSNIICVLINAAIWVRFGIKVLRRQVNWGNVLIVAYFIVPTLFGLAGARLRLPIEFLLLLTIPIKNFCDICELPVYKEGERLCQACKREINRMNSDSRYNYPI